MIQRLLMVVLVVAGMLSIKAANADTINCSLQQAMEAESVAGTAKSWTELHKYFVEYVHCDDGAIGEGFSESVSLLLSDRWNSFGQLRGILKTNPRFRHFILRHVDESVPADRLSKIAKNAGSRCPRDLKDLCIEIQKKATLK